MKPTDPNDALSRLLAAWRVAPPPQPNFRPAVWQRLRRQSRETWAGYVRAHLAGWSLLAIAYGDTSAGAAAWRRRLDGAFGRPGETGGGPGADGRFLPRRPRSAGARPAAAMNTARHRLLTVALVAGVAVATGWLAFRTTGDASVQEALVRWSGCGRISS